MNDEEMIKHVKAVIELLPKDIQSEARVDEWGEASIGSSRWGPFVEISVQDTDSYRESYVMKVEPGHRLNGKKRYFRQHKSGAFGYRKVADYVVQVVTEHRALVKRREDGESLAQSRIEALKEAFRNDPLLSSLKVGISAEPVSNTETGTVRVEFDATGRVEDLKYGRPCGFRFDGETFSGDLRVKNITVEQFIAMMAVLRFDKLNVLELLPLADDSILGPSIKAMLAKSEEHSGSEEAA